MTLVRLASAVCPVRSTLTRSHSGKQISGRSNNETSEAAIKAASMQRKKGSSSVVRQRLENSPGA